MRISGGAARGRSIHVPRGIALRPTSDRIKEALFAVLRRVEGRTFLDLFAGSGSVGLDALSRGAAEAVFVEKDVRLVRAMRTILVEHGFAGRYQIFAMEVRKCIKLLAGQRRRFEVLFADPPYDRGLAGETLRHLEKGSIVAPDGIVIVQHSTREVVEASCGKGLILTDQRRYGDTVLSFLKPTLHAEREAYEESSGISGFF